MKSRTIEKKLQFKKATISDLTGNQMNGARGGIKILLTVTCSEDVYTCEGCSAVTHCLEYDRVE